MFLAKLRRSYHILSALALAVALIVIVNPNNTIDGFLIGLLAVVTAHLLLEEKVFLVFLFLRPLLDTWRDLVLFRYHETSVTLTAAIALLFLLWSAYMLWIYRHSGRTVPLLVPGLALLVLMTGSVVYSVAPATTIIETIKFFNVFACFALGWIFIKAEKISVPLLVKTIVASAVIPLTVGLIQLFFGTGLDTFGIYGRIYGTLAHPNVFAFFVLGLIILHIQWSCLEPTRFWKNNKPLRTLVFALLITLLVFTYTRVTLIGLGLVLLVVGAYRYHRFLAWFLFSLTLFYLIVPPASVWLAKNTEFRIENTPVIARLIARNEDADSIDWRLTLIEETLPIIYARRLLGYGYGTFETVWSENRNLAHLWDDSAEAHNDYLRIALELGMVGLLLYGILLIKLLLLPVRQMIEEPKRRPYLVHIASWIGMFIAASLSDNLLHHTPVLWMMWGYWGAMIAHTEKM